MQKLKLTMMLPGVVPVIDCSFTHVVMNPQVHALTWRHPPSAISAKKRTAIKTGAHMTHVPTTDIVEDNEHGDGKLRPDLRAAKKREKDKQQEDFKSWRHEEEERQADLTAKALEEEQRQADLEAKALEEEKRQADLEAKRLEEEKRQANLRTAKKREAELDQQRHRAALDEDNFQLKPSLATYHGGHEQLPSSAAATNTPRMGKYHHEQTLADFFEEVGDSDNAGRIAIHALLDEYEGNLEELENKLFAKFGQAPSLKRPPRLATPEHEFEEPPSPPELKPQQLFAPSPAPSSSPSPRPEVEDSDGPPLLGQSSEAGVPHALVAIREAARTLAESAKDISSMNASIVYKGNPYDSADRVGYAECDADTVRIDPQLYRWTRLLCRIEALLQQSSDLRNMLYTSRSCSKAMPQVALDFVVSCLAPHSRLYGV